MRAEGAPSRGRLAPLLLAGALAGVLAACGGGPATSSSPAPVRPRPAPTAEPPAAGGLQRAWGARIVGGSIIAMAGTEYVAKVRESVPALVLVLRVTNGGTTPLPLSREKDEVVLQLRDGTRVPRADIWERADWMSSMAQMAPEERMRFVYPEEVLPSSSVDFNVTFETTAAPSEIGKVWVRLASRPSEGAWMGELAAGG